MPEEGTPLRSSYGVRKHRKASISAHPQDRRYARSGVVDADVLHVDGDVVLVREAVGHAPYVLILSDDALAHLVERRLSIPTSVLNRNTKQNHATRLHARALI